MSLKGFISLLFDRICDMESQMQCSFKFSQGELNEMLQSAKKENIPYLGALSRIDKLSSFEVSYLLSSVELNEDKINIVKSAVAMYNEEEFSAVGQTMADFIFRVSANIDALNIGNLELFKELVQCRNDVYDFTQILKKPTRLIKGRKKELAFAFQKVLM